MAKNTNHLPFSILGLLCIQELSPNRLGERERKKNTLNNGFCKCVEAECEEKSCFQKTGAGLPLKGKSAASSKVELQFCPGWQFALAGRIYHHPGRGGTENKSFYLSVSQ